MVTRFENKRIHHIVAEELESSNFWFIALLGSQSKWYKRGQTMVSSNHSLSDPDNLCFRAHVHNIFIVGGPTRTRTWDQGIHFDLIFISGVDYLITLNPDCCNRVVRAREALACY